MSTAEHHSGQAGIAPRPLDSLLAPDEIRSAGFRPADRREVIQAHLSRDGVR